MIEKRCFRCLKVLPLSDFYVHKEMADGHLNKCKECTKTDVKKRYYEKPEEIAAYERMRFETPHRKAKVIEYQRRRRERNPEKLIARQAIGNAVRDGRIVRKPCEVCGDPKSQAHHEDYSKPFDVKWLCFKHHREIGHGQKTLCSKLESCSRKATCTA